MEDAKEVTPQHKHKVSIAKAKESKKQKKTRIVDEWYEILHGKKIRRCQRVRSIEDAKTSNVYRTFVGSVEKNKDFLAKLEKKGMRIERI